MTFFFTFTYTRFVYSNQNLDVKLFLALGDGEQEIFSWTDTTPLAIEWMTFYKGAFAYDNAQVRKIRHPDKLVEDCVNNVGSFKCVGTSEEKIAIGWGGHTDSSSARPSEFSVVTADARSCMDHKIPNLGGRYSPVIGTVGQYLVACGGGDYLSSCYRLDMNAQNPSWTSAPNTPYGFRFAAMYTIGDYLYVLGGYISWSPYNFPDHYRISATGSSWEAVAFYPFKVHRHTAVVDEDNDRVFVLGGHTSYVSDRAEVYYYTPSSNSWTQISNMPWARLDVAAGIIKQKNDERWLMIQRPSYVEIYYWNLDTWSGWHHLSNSFLKFSGNMKMVSLTPYTAFMMGVNSDHYGTKTENFWVYNMENYKFQDMNRYVLNEHYWGYWTTAKKNFRIFNNCNAERTYVAVGYGGTDNVKSILCKTCISYHHFSM